MPTVSAIIPVWNGEATLRRAVDSALGQYFDGQLEIVVVNDGSTDSTQARLATYGRQIKVIEQDRRGRAAARNAGVAASSGEYLAFLDADDIWRPGKLAKTIPLLQNAKDCVLVYSNAQWIDSRSRIIGTYVPAEMAHAPTLDELLSRAWLIATPTVVMRRSTFDTCGGFPEWFALSYPGEDYHLFVLARELGAFAYVPEHLAFCGHTSVSAILEKHSAMAESGDRRSFIATLRERTRGYELAAALVRERFGGRARGLLGDLERRRVNMLISSALASLGGGDIGASRQAYRFALRDHPFYAKIIFPLLCTYLPTAAIQLLVSVMPQRVARSSLGTAAELLSASKR
jgi:glycosyltransferase involved in cell wall biosynthesis